VHAPVREGDDGTKHGERNWEIGGCSMGKQSKNDDPMVLEGDGTEHE